VTLINREIKNIVGWLDAQEMDHEAELSDCKDQKMKLISLENYAKMYSVAMQKTLASADR